MDMDMDKHTDMDTGTDRDMDPNPEQKFITDPDPNIHVISDYSGPGSSNIICFSPMTPAPDPAHTARVWTELVRLTPLARASRKLVSPRWALVRARASSRLQQWGLLLLTLLIFIGRQH